ncbi:MAG: hypothetical protein WA951_13350 [Leeuwenhoekiella sp.]
MEIISFIIIIALLLTSCSADERNEEAILFESDPDLDNWHHRQHLWMTYRKNKIRAANVKQSPALKMNVVSHFENEKPTSQTKKLIEKRSSPKNYEGNFKATDLKSSKNPQELELVELN